MPVYKDKQRNTWYVVINHRDKSTGKNKATFKRGFATKREAVTYEKEALLADKYNHTSLTFREMLDLQISAADMAESSAHDKKTAINKYFSKYIDTSIEKITKVNLSNWRDYLKKQDLAVSTKNHLIGQIKSVFKFAERVYDIPNISTALTTFKETSDDRKEMIVWTPEEFNQFIQHVESPVFKGYFTLLFWTGCRRSEGAAICKEDVIGNTISINKNLSPRTLKFSTLKTPGSKRVITVDSKTMEVLKPLIESANPYVFGGEFPACTSYTRVVFKKAIEEAGVKPIRIHDLRHSHATFLINSGANIVAVSKRLGHSSVNQTLKTYTHLMEKSNDALMEIIENSKNV